MLLFVAYIPTSMRNGWIKLHRKLLDNPIAQKPAYAWLWTTLLLLANHKENKFMWNEKIIIIKNGQLITGREELSKKSGIPPTTIERILQTLENGHQIEQQKTTKFRLITIVKWKEYQSMDSKTDNKRTTNGQQTDTIKNDKNDKNDKNIDIPSPSAPDSPFNLKEEIQKLKDSPQRHIQLIGEFLEDKKVVLENHTQFKRAIKRHLRAARELSDFSDKQIAEASKRAEQEYPKIWTLETLIKLLVK